MFLTFLLSALAAEPPPGAAFSRGEPPWGHAMLENQVAQLGGLLWLGQVPSS